MFVGEGGASSSVLLSPGRETPALQVNPADVPSSKVSLFKDYCEELVLETDL